MAITTIDDPNERRHRLEQEPAHDMRWRLAVTPPKTANPVAGL
jgi:hypothetical protein